MRPHRHVLDFVEGEPFLWLALSATVGFLLGSVLATLGWSL